MTSRALRLLSISLLCLASASAIGCGDDDNPPTGTDASRRDSGIGSDAGPNFDGGPRPDSGPDFDAGPDFDGGPDVDAGGGDAGPPPGPVITICPGDALPPLASGTCEVTAGSAAKLITADVLTPGMVFRGGQVLVDAAGAIQCVACDCSTATGAAGATTISCPDGVLSPGLINAHDHITFTQNVPYTRTAERYEQRHDWRRGIRGHARLSSAGSASREELAWGELRFVLGGATSTNGSGTSAGLLRNLDKAAGLEGITQEAAHYDTFPLGDSNGAQLTSGCGYPNVRTGSSIAGDDAYTPHIAEGIDSVSRNEFLCLREGTTDLIEPQTALIHGIGLLPIDISEMALEGTGLIWSPRSNITLYGDTARVTEYKRLGVLIALGTDWVISGSMNVLRELQCADELDTTYYDDSFTDEELWLMATRNAAEVLAMDDAIGTIAVGLVADLAIFDASGRGDHRAVIDAAPSDVALVLRGGRVLYGDAPVVTALGTTACDALDVCARAKLVCVSGETGGTNLAALTTANVESYPLFFCGTPDNEPSCVPERNAMAPLPSPVVSGSTRYSGVASATDTDGDGLPDAMDLCPRVFSPIRPLDMASQANLDGDAFGDACDPCPLNADVTVCPTPDPMDRDGDGVLNASDNCPDVPNTDQMDRDTDGKGDVCDACPDAPNPGTAACPASIYQIKDGTIPVGDRVSVTGVIVTALASNGFFAQVDPASTGFTSFDNSGVFVFTSSAPSVARGDRVDITTAQVTLFFGEIQLTGVTVAATGTGVTLPTPVAVTPAEVATGGARAAALEGVLVRVSGVAVTNPSPAPAGGEAAPTNEYEVDGALRVDDFLYRTAPFPIMGETFTSITGVLAFRRDNSKLNPRDASDLVTGTATLAALEPPLSYARAGAPSAPTFPTPLTVRLSRAAGADTTITITASGAGGLVVTDVVIPAGSATAVVPATGVVASGTPYTVTAALGAMMRTADVRVLGATEAPRLIGLTPATSTVATGGTQSFRATLDIPAPPTGTVVMLSIDMGGTVPAMLTVPGDALTASFDFTAGATAGMGRITATLDTDMFFADVMIRAGAVGGLIINEVDYDEPATDSHEFIEIFNASASSVDLANVALVMINGSTNLEYRRVALSDTLAPGEYVVVANAAVVVPPGVAVFRIPDNIVQNGAPDGVALIDTSTGTVLDALAYEGAMISVTITGFTGMRSLVEGMALAASVADSGTGPGSLARIPNGTDTDNSATDWQFVTSPSPGAAN